MQVDPRSVHPLMQSIVTGVRANDLAPAVKVQIPTYQITYAGICPVDTVPRYTFENIYYYVPGLRSRGIFGRLRLRSRPKFSRLRLLLYCLGSI